MDMRRLVGRNVKRFREKKGLTQEQFDDLSGFSQQYISALERGTEIQRLLRSTNLLLRLT
jgi:transcriptional regulator with XRE-family HTH domain